RPPAARFPYTTRFRSPGVEFFTGYITEYSLSIDNLFIFMVIMASFRVPAIHQHRVLLIGILLALVMRAAFIAVGAVLIAKFVWIDRKSTRLNSSHVTI